MAFFLAHTMGFHLTPKLVARIAGRLSCNAIICYLLLLISCGFKEVVSQVITSGKWELLVKNGGVSAMHMMLLPSNKVIIFDRTDYGPSNIRLAGGACREDPNDLAMRRDCWAHSIEYDIITNSIRPLTLQTDTWCSSGGLDAQGDLVQTGGFNDGARTARHFKSDCNSCDWQEAPNELSVSRWYASNQILPDGTFIIVGGRRQFNYEFFPKHTAQQPSVYILPFLAYTTDIVENNLYPFLHLSPDGNLFIFANAKSILLDYKRNIVIRRYPDMPGGEAHNYPSSGSSVMLPIFASEGSPPADILVCGGAPKTSNIEANKGNFVPASSSCGMLRITEETPVWGMQTMPMPRVMGDMILLPTCDVLIINGAQRGTAGWGAASDPAYAPLLYLPYANQFDVLRAATTARMYHSTAILLPDARVLVGGSNTHVGYNFTDPLFPTQLSLEAFSPPYLDPQYTAYRPQVTYLSSGGVLSHGSPFKLQFEVQTLVDANDVQVNMVSPSFTTHSYGMNQRMLRLLQAPVQRLSAIKYEVGVQAPPSPVIAPHGYYLLFVVHSTIPSEGIWVRI